MSETREGLKKLVAGINAGNELSELADEFFGDESEGQVFTDEESESMINELRNKKVIRRIPVEKDRVTAYAKGDYRVLADVLIQALLQAQEGKGAERHANGRPFTEQPIMVITGIVGDGFPTGQAMKKIQESMRMDKDAAIRERLGAINYLAASIIALSESMDEGKSDNEGN